jgi:hypothetical protein
MGDGLEGEDIEILEPALDEDLAMIDKGDIVDAKTILLLDGLMRGDENEAAAERPAESPGEAQAAASSSANAA